MNRDLATLRDWATDRSKKDEDVAARPLWSQIAGEVGAYLDEPPRPSDDQDSLFGGDA